MARSIRAAAVQLRAHDRADFRASLDRIVDAVRAAAATADLVVLPEGTLPGYVLGDAPIDEREIAGAIDRLREVATRSRTVIVAGAAVAAQGGVRNSALVIDADGALAGRADKFFLWHFDRRWFARGEDLAPIATAIGVLGVFVCADGRIPTIARALVDRGAEVLVMPTAWVTSGRDPDALENVQADLLARVRAYENGVPFVAANKCGSELGMVAYCGKSQIVDASGERLAIASQHDPETVAAQFEIAAAKPHRTPIRPIERRASETRAPVRIAISFDALPADIDDRLRLLDDRYALSPSDPQRLSALDRDVPLARVEDGVVLDPAGLVAYRRAGYQLICWTTDLAAPWSERIARARALELRIYLVVFDRPRRRAFAVDPDGAILAGTFDGYLIAGFALDPRRTLQTLVAPGTDVAEGLERVSAILT
ncbi:MAG TPA: carbon-nitrogen hydrolase family protein [Candidatus Binatia bacterium]|nr:carbon-nitrogen hydrolase family protein [Candidatus Binatia bacterium]